MTALPNINYTNIVYISVYKIKVTFVSAVGVKQIANVRRWYCKVVDLKRFKKLGLYHNSLTNFYHCPTDSILSAQRVRHATIWQLLLKLTITDKKDRGQFLFAEQPATNCISL